MKRTLALTFLTLILSACQVFGSGKPKVTVNIILQVPQAGNVTLSTTELSASKNDSGKWIVDKDGLNSAGPEQIAELENNFADAFAGFSPPTFKIVGGTAKDLTNNVVSSDPNFNGAEMNINITTEQTSAGMAVAGYVDSQLIWTYTDPGIQADFLMPKALFGEIANGTTITANPNITWMTGSYIQPEAVDGVPDYIGTVSANCAVVGACARADYLVGILSGLVSEPVLGYKQVTGDQVTITLTINPHPPVSAPATPVTPQEQ